MRTESENLKIENAKYQEILESLHYLDLDEDDNKGRKRKPENSPYVSPIPAKGEYELVSTFFLFFEIVLDLLIIILQEILLFIRKGSTEDFWKHLSRRYQIWKFKSQ
jgi:hypothetical protein